MLKEEKGTLYYIEMRWALPKGREEMAFPEGG